MKIKSTRQFKERVDAAFETQKTRDEAKACYDFQREEFKAQEEELCAYAAANPEVFEGRDGVSEEQPVTNVKCKMQSVKWSSAQIRHAAAPAILHFTFSILHFPCFPSSFQLILIFIVFSFQPFNLSTFQPFNVPTPPWP